MSLPPNYVHNPRASQGYIGPLRSPALRELVAKGVRGLGLLYVLGLAFGCKIYLDRKSAESMHEARLFESSVESGDWKCYHTMRQYHAECSQLDP